ncbi:MAG: pyridoxal phosphate-dependent aminotransferase [Treponema sp.]|nr:pyridoxal phosphate-dependent aminotransferase [Treponema sp.]
MKYKFDKITDRKNTFAIKYDLAQDRNKPVDAIPLWVADMDFPTAPCILKALKKCSGHGIFGYSRPDKRYYDAVKKWFASRHNFIFEDSQIVNTPGVIFAVAAAIRAFAKEGDGVIIQKPVYYPFENAIKSNGRRVVNSPLVFKDGQYQIDFEDFEKKIIQENVKLFILCSPHNPGGRVWKKEELERLSQICLSHKVFVVSDEIHSDITFGKHNHTVYANLSKEAADNSIICTSPSKTFNLAGLQFSNIIVKNKENLLLLRRQIETTGFDEPNVMGITAATAAYSQGAEWFEAAKEYIWKNILFIEEYFAKHCPKIKVVKSEGTYLIWLDFTAYTRLSGKEISELILNKAKVWLDDGTMFGPEGDKFERINAATPRRILQKALENIAQVFSNL